MYLIGDIHGRFKDYFRLINILPKNEKSIQLGDTGIGFPQINYREWDTNHKVLRRKS